MLVKHRLYLGGRSFDVWQEHGKVKQSGRLSLPEVLETFGDTKQGRREAGAYIAGMLRAARIAKPFLGKEE